MLSVSSYEEALAKQRGKKFLRFNLEAAKSRRRRLMNIRVFVKKEVPAGMKLFYAMDKGKYIPCAHVYGDEEHGDLLMAQIAIIGPSSLPRMEAANDSQA